MTQSFKKALACLLAVLMVVFAAPISALATYADDFDPDVVSTYHPDLQVQFGAFFDADDSFDTPEGPWVGKKNQPTFDYIGLYGPPVIATMTNDTTTGGINITKLEQKASLSGDAAVSFDLDAINKVYGEDDFFTATFRLDNVNTATFVSTALNYSSNIELAGYYTKGSGTSMQGNVGTIDECDAAGASAQIGVDSVVETGGGELYEDANFKFFGDDSELGDNLLRICYTAPTAFTPTSLESADDDHSFIDPVTGAADYAYENCVIYYTVVFKIVGDFDASHPITFTPADTTASTWVANQGGSYSALVAEQENFATYSNSTFNTPAKEQFTFFGMNINSGEGCSGGDVHTHTMTPTAAVAATCTEAGNSAYWYCSGCDKYFSDADGNTEIAENSWVIAALGHDLGAWTETTAAVPATCTTAGATAIETRSCSRCDYSETRGGDVVPATGIHTYESVVTAPTCTEAGYTTYTCSVCGNSYTEAGDAALGHAFGEWTEVTPATEESTGLKRRECSRCDAYEEEVIPKLDHTHVPGEPAQENVVAATCTEAGSYDLVVRCTSCNEIISSEPQVIPALGHDLGAWTETTAAVPATCTEAGTTAVETRECSRCDYSETRGGETVAALGHDWSNWTVVTPATKTKKGEEKRTCARCNLAETREIDSLDIIVTVEAENGTVVCEGKEGAGPYSFKFGDHFVLNATPAEGYQFVSWKINDKVVKEDDTMYDSNAYADVTITPVFAKAQASEYEVVFLDLYKKVAKKVTVASAAELEAAAPTAADMARQGYTFLGWDKELSEITAPCDVTAQYVRDEAATGYTVTVEGADDVTINGEAVKAKDGIPFDSKVTVVANGAKGFKIGDTVVSTSDTYSFYVGADVTVTAIMNEDVAKANVIDILSVTPVSGSYKYQFLATRTLASGYKLEKVGFVYGKNLADDELVIDKVGQPGAGTNAGQIKVGYNNINNVLETVLQYGLKNGDGTAKARAFMIVSKGGKSEVIYSTIKGWDYVNGAVIDGGIPVIDDGD